MNYSQIAAAAYDSMDRSTSIPEDQFRKTSVLHGQACKEVNDRLQRACTWIAQGMNAQAIQECEREPNLLDAVAALDIPNNESWVFLHDLFNMEIPPAVRFDWASQINQAYSENAPLETLLQKQRLLALGQASLASRLQVLRQIATRDPENEKWIVDIEEMERARLAQIKREVESSPKGLETVSRLSQEMGKRWRIKIPDQLTDRVSTLFRKTRSAELNSKLAAVASELSARHSEMDVERARVARQEWEQLVAKLGTQPNANVEEQAKVALDWLAREDERELQFDQFQSLQHELSQELDDVDTTAETLERLYGRLTQYDFEISEATRKRYHLRLNQFKVRESRRFQLKMLSVVLGAALVAFLVWKGVAWSKFRGRVGDVKNTIDTYVNNKDWEKAFKTHEALETQIQAAPVVVEAYVPVTTKIRQRADAIEKLKSLLGQIGEIDLTDGNLLTDAIAQADIIESLAGLPGDPEEALSQLDTKGKVFNALVSDESKIVDSDLKSFLDTVRNALAGDDTATEDLEELKEELVKRLHDSYLTNEMKMEGEVVLTDVTNRIGDLALQAEKERQRQSIIDSIGNWNQFASALSNAYGDLLTEEQMVTWETATKWGSETQKLPRRSWRKFTRKEAEDFLFWVSNGGGVVSFPQLEQYKNLLEPTTRRDPNKISSRIQAFNKFPRRSAFYVVENGDRYYCESDRLDGKPSRGKWTVDCVVEFGGGNKKMLRVRTSEKPRSSPHEKLAEDIRAELQKLREGEYDWDRPYYEILKLILDQSDNNEIDAFILAEWLYEAWKDGTESCGLLRRMFGDWETDFVNEGIDWGTNSLKPGAAKDTANAKSRTLLQKLRRKFKSKSPKNVLAELPTIIPRFKWTGAVIEEDGTSVVVPESVTGTLYAPSSKSGKISLVEIGEADGKSVKTTINLSDLGLGCPVFVRGN